MSGQELNVTYHLQLLQNLQYDLKVSKQCTYVFGKSFNMSGLCFDEPQRRPLKEVNFR